MLRDGKKYTDFKDFCDEYGVVETIYETESEYNANRRSMTRKLRDRLLPGVSPLVYSRFLLENAVFLSLSDMGKELPEYEEIPVAVPMREDVEEEYRRLQQTFQKIIRSDRRIAQKVLSAFMGLLTVYPDQPYGHKPIVHPLDSEIVLADPQDLSCPEELQEKDRQVLELVERKVRDGERVLIYTSWVRIDTQEKLLRLLTEKGIPAAVLSARVPPGKREAWVNQQVENGVQVLICNPSVVETGLDLIPFTALIYYNISYNLFTLRQSSRRSWRINQSAPRIEVYFFYYKNTMQNRAMELMASKLAVASVIEGNMSDEGLAAMSDCKDLTSQLAKELASGIRCEVEDLSEVFGRMAIRHVEEKEPKTVKADVPQTQKLTVEKEPFFTEAAEAMKVSAVPEPETVFLFASPKRSRKKALVPLPDSEEQLSLFGIPA